MRIISFTFFVLLTLSLICGAAGGEVVLTDEVVIGEETTETIPNEAILNVTTTIEATDSIVSTSYQLTGIDEPTPDTEYYIANETILYEAAGQSLTQLATLRPNSLVTGIARNGDMLRVRATVLNQIVETEYEGYIPQSAARLGVDPSKQYYLYLNKATHTLTAYLADEKGKATGDVARLIECAIGRTTAPTNPGIYQLGETERWHKFESTYTPFAIEFTKRRYLHGPLYTDMDEDTVIPDKLGDIGSNVTGGCLRMAYDDIMWIYFNCGEGTTLEVVNKGGKK